MHLGRAEDCRVFGARALPVEYRGRDILDVPRKVGSKDCTGASPPAPVTDLASAIEAAGITLPSCDMAVLNVRPGS